MKAIKIGNTYDIYDDSLQTFERLPAKTYSVYFTKQGGFHLKERAGLAVSEKIYGVHEVKADKVLRSFMEFSRNLGVILSGDKGIGKSLFARVLCEKAVQRGLPVIIIDQFIPGIAAYIESVEQECVVLFDEFDKTFRSLKDDEVDPQAQLLSLFDGVSSGKKLFVVTCNDLRGLNDYLVNRPGRFHYHFRFNYPSAQEIREYLTDSIAEEHYGEIDKVIAFSRRVDLNYDCLRAIAFELDQGADFESAIQDLNIVNTDTECYRVTLYFDDGTFIFDRSCYIDMFDPEAVISAALDNKRGRTVGHVDFAIGNVIYDPSTGGMTVDGENVDLCLYDDEDGDPYKGKKITHLSITRAKPKSIRYFDV